MPEPVSVIVSEIAVVAFDVSSPPFARNET